MRADSCCCFDLSTGTYLILTFEIMTNIYFIIDEFHKEFLDELDDALMIYAIICIGTAIFGLGGVTQQKPAFLIPYVVTAVISLVVWPPIGILRPTDFHWTGGYFAYPILLLIQFISFVLSVYFIFVVLSYITELKEEEEGKKNANQNTTSVAHS